MRRFSRLEGVLVQPVGHLWAAFSPATGETTLLNDECASILEVLEIAPADAQSISIDLSSDCGLTPSELIEIVEASWSQLIDAGLVREMPVR